MITLLEQASMVIGGVLIFLGGIFDLIAAIGVNKFPDLYTRLHAVTIGAIGGAVYPIIGSILLVLGMPSIPIGVKLSYVLPMSFTAALIIVTAPTGSHAIARAAYRSGYKPRKRWGGEE